MQKGRVRYFKALPKSEFSYLIDVEEFWRDSTDDSVPKMVDTVPIMPCFRYPDYTIYLCATRDISALTKCEISHFVKKLIAVCSLSVEQVCRTISALYTVDVYVRIYTNVSDRHKMICVIIKKA